ncbi:nucleocytoplasmic transporter NUP145 PWA37_002081 [Arxiozyma heterogenica]|uniref:nucleocytoplasmic transporter NUP145 n=1 Tax=Arxiozyma heterogenica TaxID=278026 RepID=UPI002F115004
MFNTKLNSSTPFSTPAPAPTGNNTSLFAQKPNGLFNNVNNATSLGTSTPSPSTGLFGNKPTTQSTTTLGGGLFGNSTTSQNKPGGLFGTATSNTTITNTPTGGLFGNSAIANKNTTLAPPSGLFGNSTSTKQNPGGLFGSKPTTATATGTTTGGLFGNSSLSKTNTIGSTTGSSLFGNSSTNTLNGNNLSGGGNIFSNKPTSVNSLFGNSATSQPAAPQQLQLNPYGLNVSCNTTVNISNMPAPIVETVKKVSDEESRPENTKKPILTNKRSFSATSNITTPINNASHSSLFHNLNSKLNTINNIKSTKGIFSSSWNSTEYLKSNNSLNQRVTTVKDIAKITNKYNNVQEMRRLKIDTERSAIKKMKLLSGTPLITKSNSQEKPRETITDNVVESKAKDKDQVEAQCSNLDTKNNDEGKSDKTSKLSEKDNFNSNNIVTENTEYWCSPSIETLSKMPPTKLKTISNFIIGRKGFGNISFNYAVDLSAFVPNLKEELFGKTVTFHSTKTVEVYPDQNNKPAVGYGLNVPATISLEKIYPIDKKTKKPITDVSKTDEIQVLITKLKNMRDMEFVSYNPFGGIWTFKVNHFSIWGLINEEDAEVDKQEIDTCRQNTCNDIYPTNYGSGKQHMNFQSISNKNDEDYLMEDSESMLNENIIQVKQYEPDISEQDFDALQANPDLNVSDNWVEQLKLAGSCDHTIFTNGSELMSIQDTVKKVFGKFNKEHDAYRQITKNQRLGSTSNFSSILFNNSILIKNRHSISGVSIYTPKSECGNKFNIKRELFQKHIASSIVAIRSSSQLPYIKEFDLKFSDILQIVPQNDPMYNVWKLCSILFDGIELSFEVENDTVKETLLKQMRYDQLSSWLKNNTTPILHNKDIDKSDPLDCIFIALLKNDIVEATKLAISTNNKHLAVLISYLGSNDPRIRDLSKLQLTSWKANGHSVNPKIRKVYQLLSGELFNDKLQITNFIEQYGWLPTFSLAIFYGQVDEMSLEELIGCNLFIIEKADDILISKIFEIYAQVGNIDKLLEQISTNTAKNSNINIQFIWYLTQILIFRNHRSISKSLQDHIGLSYIDQLKLLGSALPALYVSLFINDNNIMQQTSQDILDHNISFIWKNPEERNMILEKLKLPKKNVYEALALYEKYNGNYIKEIEYLILGGLFENAGKLICSEVGPKLLLCYNQDKDAEYLNILKDFLEKISPSKYQKTSQELSIFSQFIELVSNNKNKDFKKEHITSLQENVNKYYEDNKHIKIVPACCNIINKRLQTMLNE